MQRHVSEPIRDRLHEGHQRIVASEHVKSLAGPNKASEGQLERHVAHHLGRGWSQAPSSEGCEKVRSRVCESGMCVSTEHPVGGFDVLRIDELL